MYVVRFCPLIFYILYPAFLVLHVKCSLNFRSFEDSFLERVSNDIDKSLIVNAGLSEFFLYNPVLSKLM